MNDITLIPPGGEIFVRPNGEGGGISIDLPFPSTIVLHEDIVMAGTTHIANLDRILEPVSFPADVSPIRDPGNLHDPWTIKAMMSPDRIGFVPCDVNEVLARLIDGGKRIEGAVLKRDFWGNGPSCIWR
ncbi:hypothetical protein [uncultured Slackia sp.]|uniref:hypothetical protein n=1 Tax=uncultured Slackia sp. TaxID=665903 RepID=UPI00280A6A3D|nr:hypothetical protein [uncultured Slackia sp.]